MICDICKILRSQSNPSPVYPSKHVQKQLPIVLVQVALPSQLFRPVVHSSISSREGHKILTKNIFASKEKFKNAIIAHTTLQSYIPVQLVLFSVISQPGRKQLQKKLPSVLLHTSAHPPFSTKHSLTSMKTSKTSRHYLRRFLKTILCRVTITTHALLPIFKIHNWVPIIMGCLVLQSTGSIFQALFNPRTLYSLPLHVRLSLSSMNPSKQLH